MDNLAYLLQSIAPSQGASSVLTSTSKFLNHPGLRDWIAAQYLRRNGADRPSSSDTASGLIPAMNELADVDTIERLMAAERLINPRFATWLDEGLAPPHTLEFFAGYPEGSFGHRYHRYMIDQGLKPNLDRAVFTPATPYEFARYRFGQIHDFEHIISGGGFDTLGEILPFFVRMSAIHRHLSPELAGALTPVYVLGGFRFLVRAGLNYPQVFLTALDLMQRGIRIGLESDPIFMARFEDVLSLTPEAAREALGVRHAEDVDTREASRIFDDAG
jgi:ubiquinone biosynthesis protein COQ4